MSYSMNQPRGADAFGNRPSHPAAPPDMRNGSSGRPSGRPVEEAAASTKDLAIRFEDEKRRIIESCFAKRDADGTQLESYITHLKIVEDAMYPSSPPPPNSPAANKKNRLIMVAVRRSGKVRVHKARENPNGSYSIGKTWNLDELTAVQSYVAFIPNNNQENMEKQWAGGMGFVVSLGKPYYWQASSQKEKDFFIASLIKIFRKYTGGKMPQLVGFAPQEMDLLNTGTPGSTPVIKNQSPNPAANSGLPTPVPTPPSIPAAASPRPQSPLAPRAPSRTNNLPEPGRERVYSRNEVRPGTRQGERVPSGEPTRSPARFPQQAPSNEDMRKRSFGERSYQDPFSKSAAPLSEMPQPLRPSGSPKSSQAPLPQTDASAGRTNGVPLPGMSQFGPGRRSAGSKSQESIGAISDYSNPSRPATAADRRSPEPVPPVPPVSNDALPDRLRPKIGNNNEASASQRSLQSTPASQFATPLGTPVASKSEESAPPKPNTRFGSQSDLTAEPGEYFESKSEPQQSVAEEPTRKAAVPQPTPVPDVPATGGEGAVTSPDGITSPSEGELSPKKDEEYRPGLGPMIKKKSAKDIANQFRKAALAASAFQPRQGGAGARLKALQEKNSNEPDGITGVVPAPLFRGMSQDSVSSQTAGVTSPAPDKEKERPRTPLKNSFLPKVQLQRTATEDSVATSDSGAKAADVPQDQPRAVGEGEAAEQPRTGSPQRKRRQKHEAEIEKYCSVLAIDPRVMEGRGADFNEILTEFGWEGRLSEKQKIEDFESAIRRENGRAQASGWLGHVEQQEARVQDLSKAFDKAIAECEEMDGLLTLYSHELDTLAEDIEYIEAQSQGLQVQTANQKLLQAELQSLLKTLTISSNDLQALQAAPFDSNEGVQAVERSLLLLYRALLTIDPEIRQNKTRQAANASNDRTGVGVYADQEIGQMRAVRQKKEEYQEETLQFLRRFNQHMTAMFKQAEQRTSEDNSRSLTSTSATSLSLPSLQSSRQELWLYNPMMLFVREVNNYEWSTLISSYEINIKAAYVENFREHVSSQRKTARKPTGEEREVLFTHQEKDRGEDSITSTAARKLTVKRGKTVKATVLRQTFGEKRDGKPDAWEVFDNVLQEHTKLIAEEQNFVVHFFHLNSQSNIDFLDNVSSKAPSQRMLPNLATQLPYDPDRDLAKQVQSTVEGIYSFWATDLQGLMEWVLQSDQLQGVGVLCALERSLSVFEETNQEYITRTLRALHDRLTGLFHKFIDDQVKAVEETKVKVSKRKGVIPFMRTFPVFSAAVESMIPQEFYHNESLELRFILNDAYVKILKAMWESLNFIAKDNPASGSGHAQTGPGTNDPEDKEALNYHILLIENMNHYVEEVETHQNVVLEEWRERAEHDMYKHLTQYTDTVIRRPLGKWLDFLESTEALMKAHDSFATIANKPSHSRSSAKKILSSFDAKEVRKGAETLKKRIEKHFGDADDPAGASKGLISKVFEECGTRYAHAYDRMKTIIDQVYESTLEVEWRKDEVVAVFRR